METTLTAAVAVLGTLLGAVVTHVFGRRERLRAERTEQARQLRAERLAVFAEFADGVSALRGAQAARQRLANEGEGGTDRYAEVKAESNRLRAVTRAAVFKMRLLGVDAGLVELAHDAIDRTVAVRHATSVGDLRDRSDAAREAAELFVEAAARQVTAE